MAKGKAKVAEVPEKLLDLTGHAPRRPYTQPVMEKLRKRYPGLRQCSKTKILVWQERGYKIVPELPEMGTDVWMYKP